MPDGSQGLPIRNPIYPDGCAVLLAWDHCATANTSSTTYLLRGSGGYFVHYHMVDHTIGDNVLSLSVQDAEYLYGRLRVQVVPRKNAFD